MDSSVDVPTEGEVLPSGSGPGPEFLRMTARAPTLSLSRRTVPHQAYNFCSFCLLTVDPEILGNCTGSTEDVTSTTLSPSYFYGRHRYFIMSKSFFDRKKRLV